jgi:hypothetical protein
MGQISLRDWVALLSEAGVTFSSGAGLRGAAEAAAQRLDVKLEPEDLATLSAMEDELSPGAPRMGTFASWAVCHIPAVEQIPHRPDPGGGDGIHPRMLNKSSAPPLPLPPWGQMDETLETFRIEAVIPIDWMPADGSPPTGKQWGKFIEDLTTGIGSMLWPPYTPGDTSAWSTPAIAKLFEADFKLLGDLHFNLGMPINAYYPTKFVHSDFFKEEDDASIEFGTGYERYDPTLAPTVLKSFTTVLIAGMADKVGSLDLQLKHVFQRPRAYQVALIQNRSDFNYRQGRTANTPSLVSGHCLQSTIAGCTAYVAFIEDLDKGNPRSVETLQQFTVDIGDRRVFAGIHYPSDNLSSWYTALTLVPRVFPKLRDRVLAKEFLWEAISQRSEVFKAIKAYKDSQGNSPYTAIVKEIERLGAAGG